MRMQGVTDPLPTSGSGPTVKVGQYVGLSLYRETQNGENKVTKGITWSLPGNPVQPNDEGSLESFARRLY